jgi:hypothetical protein
MAPKKRKKIDWAKGDELIKQDRLSKSEIARQLGCSEGAVRKRINEKNLGRDLSGDVQRAARGKLVRDKVRSEDESTSELSDDEIIDKAASIQADIVRGHQTRIGKRLLFVEKLVDVLEQLTNGHDEIPDIIKGLRSKNEKAAAAAFKKVSSMPQIIKGFSDLVKAEDSLIKMERQAFNITGGEEDDPDKNPKSGKWVLEVVAAKDHD